MHPGPRGDCYPSQCVLLVPVSAEESTQLGQKNYKESNKYFFDNFYKCK
jgi:hypothetical protein